MCVHANMILDLIELNFSKKALIFRNNSVVMDSQVKILQGDGSGPFVLSGLSLVVHARTQQHNTKKHVLFEPSSWS